MLLLAQKLLSLAQGMMPANDVIDDPQLLVPRKVFRQLDEYSNAFFNAEAKDNYRQLYCEVLDFVVSGLCDRFEPDATVVH